MQLLESCILVKQLKAWAKSIEYQDACKKGDKRFQPLLNMLLAAISLHYGRVLDRASKNCELKIKNFSHNKATSKQWDIYLNPKAVYAVCKLLCIIF